MESLYPTNVATIFCDIYFFTCFLHFRAADDESFGEVEKVPG